MTWAIAAGIFIEAHTADFPADWDLRTRARALDEIAWRFHGGTSWGRKIYARAKRDYLELHGLPKRARKAPDAKVYKEARLTTLPLFEGGRS